MKGRTFAVHTPGNPLVDPTAALWQIAMEQQVALADAEAAMDSLDVELGSAIEMIAMMRDRLVIAGGDGDWDAAQEADRFLTRLMTGDKFEGRRGSPESGGPKSGVGGD